MAEEKKPNFVLASEHEKVCLERDRALAAAEAARQYEREALQQRVAVAHEFGALTKKMRERSRNSYRNDGQLVLETGHLSICTNLGPVDECRNCYDVSQATRLVDTILRERWEAELDANDARAKLRQQPEDRRSRRQAGATRSVVTAPGGLFPTIVCLCGSTRFSAAFREANLKETLAGKIVLTIGCDLRSDDETLASMSDMERDATKRRLDALHLRKVDLADEVVILNVGDYVGESAQRELDYARAQSKRVRWLEFPTARAHSGEEAAW